MSDEASWRRCSTCKQPIHFKAGYFTCSVSTCSRKGNDFVFCSVNCWDAHLPTLRHREAWAEEQTAPSAAEWARQQQESAQRESAPSRVRSSVSAMDARRESAPVRVAERPAPGAHVAERPASSTSESAPSSPHGDPVVPRESSLTDASEIPREILVVVSKLKNYVRARSGMNTSDEVIETLSDRLRTLCDKAIAHAREDSRKTIMSRDFRNLP